MRSDYEALKWLLTTPDSLGKLTRWIHHLSESYFDLVHKAGIKYQAPDALSGLDTNEEDRISPDDNLPVLTIGGQCDGEVLLRRNEDDRSYDYEELDEGPAPFLPEVFKLSRRQGDDLEKVTSQRKFLETEKKDEESCKAADATGVPNRIFSMHEQEILVGISQLDGAAQLYVPRSLCKRFL